MSTESARTGAILISWTSPFTAIANTPYTAAQHNLYVRDNLNETAPAKATTAGGIFVATGSNAIAQRIPTADTVAASETTALTSYTGLSTPGPTFTVTTGAKAIVCLTAFISNSVAGAHSNVGYVVTGASSISAFDSAALRHESDSANQFVRATAVMFEDGLTPGANTFFMQYRVGSGTGTFANRHMIVIPL